ncbi:CBU_0592 family membrane protein [Parapedobacter sp. DT-150]|uniref:CBU_0592 family membrane protein n=1 Tax=Parapedobacter sp. DT-150 TaxID=3396162 RepID=UPI003F1BFA2A
MAASAITAIGWLGFIFCTVAYLLLNTRMIRFDGALYQVLNAIGGLGLVISAIYFNDGPNIAANIVWVLIAVFGIFRYAKKLRGLRKKRNITDAQ